MSRTASRSTSCASPDAAPLRRGVDARGHLAREGIRHAGRVDQGRVEKGLGEIDAAGRAFRAVVVQAIDAVIELAVGKTEHGGGELVGNAGIHS